MKKHRLRLTILLVLALVILGGLALPRLLAPSADTLDAWQELQPFWGKKPGTSGRSISTYLNGTLVTAHHLLGAEDWVKKQREVFSCGQVEPNAVDQGFIDAHLNSPEFQRQHAPQREGCTVWRSQQRYDLEGTRYQAVQPTFICFSDGDCLFYLYDWYNQETLDAIPPPCQVLRRRGR